MSFLRATAKLIPRSLSFHLLSPSSEPKRMFVLQPSELATGSIRDVNYSWLHPLFSWSFWSYCHPTPTPRIHWLIVKSKSNRAFLVNSIAGTSIFSSKGKLVQKGNYFWLVDPQQVHSVSAFQDNVHCRRQDDSPKKHIYNIHRPTRLLLACSHQTLFWHYLSFKVGVGNFTFVVSPPDST